MNKIFVYSLFITVIFLFLFVIFVFGFEKIDIKRDLLNSFFCFTIFLTYFFGLKDIYFGLERGKAHLYTGSILSMVLGVSIILMYFADILNSYLENGNVKFTPETDLIVILFFILFTLPGLLIFKGRKIHS